MEQLGVCLFLPSHWGGAGSTLIYVTREHFEPELTHLARFVRPGSVVIDAGANVGIYTVVAATLVGRSGKVLAFEPNPVYMEVLRRNVRLNALKNVDLFDCAVDASDARGRLYHYADSGPVSYAIAPGYTGNKGSEEVKTVRLESVLRRLGLDRIDFIKLDIEGAELAALQGASGFLTRCKPIVVFEINQNASARFGLEPDACWRYLEALDYLFFVLQPNGTLLQLMDVPDEKAWEHQNVVAIHLDRASQFSEIV